MDRTEFERRLSDYVRGELPNAVAREFDDYLAAHPETAGDVEAARTILELSADISASEPPAQLLAAARASTLKAIRSEHEQPRQSGFWLALPRPAWMSALAIATGRPVSRRTLARNIHAGVGAGGRGSAQTLFGAHGGLVPRGKGRAGAGEALVPGPSLFPPPRSVPARPAGGSVR